MTSLGTDAGWSLSSPDPKFRWANGKKALLLFLLRGLIQPRNKLPYWRGWGEDLRELVGSNTSLGEIERRVERQLRRSERVKLARAIASRGDDGAVIINCVVDIGEGPFPFVMSASQAAVKLLSIQGQNG